jgi:histidyl-tRNA synthetase
VEYPLAPARSDKQFKRAMELKARFTCQVQPTAGGGVEVRVKNLATRAEKVVKYQS